MSSRTHRQAFTLIELLVVVAIIALLISILLPSLARAREAARQVKCASNMKQLGMGNHMYANSNDQWYVLINDAEQGAEIGWSIWNANNAYRSIMGQEPVPDPVPSGYDFTENHWDKDMFCPSRADQKESNNYFGKTITGDYGFNTITINFYGSEGYKGTRVAAVVSPASKVQMTEAIAYSTDEGSAQPANWNAFGDIYGGGDWNYVTYRHGGQGGDTANVLHFDGHVAGYHHTELYPHANKHAKCDQSDALWDILDDNGSWAGSR